MSGDFDETAPEGERINCRLVKWTEIQSWSEDVAAKVKSSGFAPDLIVGITRGGWVPARIMCDIMGVKGLYSLKTEHWGVTAAADGCAKLVAKPEISMTGKNVLVVDDITDTGESLSLAVSCVKEQKPKAVKVATLLHITHSKLEPEFYSVRVPKEEWAWFIFPWNLHEDIRTLLPKTLVREKDVRGITAAFRAQFNIDVDRVVVEKALASLEASGAVKKSGKSWKKA